jgi:transglutaminase-like putative cysteine protease
VLLAALCRARGIPARVAVGLVYSPEDQGFLFHMWNEVWVDDRWYPLDATLGRGGTEADRLLMVQSSFADGSAYRFLSPVVQALSDVSFVVAESVSTSAVGNE